MDVIIYIIFALGAVVLSILKGMKEKQGEPGRTPAPKRPAPDVWVATKENVQKMLTKTPRAAAVQPLQEAVEAVIVDVTPMPETQAPPSDPRKEMESNVPNELTPLQNAVIYAELLAPPLALRRRRLGAPRPG